MSKITVTPFLQPLFVSMFTWSQTLKTGFIQVFLGLCSLAITVFTFGSSLMPKNFPRLVSFPRTRLFRIVIRRDATQQRRVRKVLLLCLLHLSATWPCFAFAAGFAFISLHCQSCSFAVPDCLSLALALSFPLFLLLEQPLTGLLLLPLVDLLIAFERGAVDHDAGVPVLLRARRLALLGRSLDF